VKPPAHALALIGRNHIPWIAAVLLAIVLVGSGRRWPFNHSACETGILHRGGEHGSGDKIKGSGLRAISRQLGMAVSSIHSVLAGKKAKR
jgi:predicted trehalose synthase